MKDYEVGEESVLLPSAMFYLMLCENSSHSEAQRKYLSLMYERENRELTSDTMLIMIQFSIL
jgi:hypothetical protein